jgi:hypothetical protein
VSQTLRSERLKMKRGELSELRNTIILYIMSFMMIKDVVKTSFLTKRWKNLWKHLPNLKLISFELKKTRFSAACVSGIVSSRSKGKYPLHTLEFDHRCFF